jgi:hypothetical protein
MSDYAARTATGAKAGEVGRAAIETDIKKLKAPADPLAAVAYWDHIKQVINGRDYEALTAARDAGHDWAQIGAALGTSPENARRRWHYFKNR